MSCSDAANSTDGMEMPPAMPPTIMPDDQPLELGELELPAENPAHLVEDEFVESCGLRLSFLGLGHGGSQIADAFYRLGYARAVAVADAHGDWAIPTSHQIRALDDLSPEHTQGLRALNEAIGKKAASSWGEGSDLCFLCLAAGDPLAASAGPSIAKTIRKTFERISATRRARVGAIISLPSLNEGAEASKTALTTLQWLQSRASSPISPLILIDNEHIARIFGNESPAAKRAACLGAARVLHLFNRQASEPEPERFAAFWEMMDSGPMYLGAQIVRIPQEPNALNSALVWELNANLFCPAPLGKARQAAILLMASESDASGLTEKSLRRAFRSLSRRLGPNPKIHRLVGASQGPGLLIASLIADCPLPADRIFDMAELAGEPRGVAAELLGIAERDDY